MQPNDRQIAEAIELIDLTDTVMVACGRLNDIVPNPNWQAVIAAAGRLKNRACERLEGRINDAMPGRFAAFHVDDPDDGDQADGDQEDGDQEDDDQEDDDYVDDPNDLNVINQHIADMNARDAPTLSPEMQLIVNIATMKYDHINPGGTSVHMFAYGIDRCIVDLSSDQAKITIGAHKFEEIPFELSATGVILHFPETEIEFRFFCTNDLY